MIRLTEDGRCIEADADGLAAAHRAQTGKTGDKIAGASFAAACDGVELRAIGRPFVVPTPEPAAPVVIPTPTPTAKPSAKAHR